MLSTKGPIITYRHIYGIVCIGSCSHILVATTILPQRHTGPDQTILWIIGIKQTNEPNISISTIPTRGELYVITITATITVAKTSPQPQPFSHLIFYFVYV